MGRLTIIQQFVLFSWFITGSTKFYTYKYWIEMGLQPKYAYEKTIETLN